jgi:hypothetical protein
VNGGHVNPAGLNCQDLDISAESYGTSPPTICQWSMQVKDGKFVVLPPKGGGKPYWTGKLIGASVTENTTTTTAAP